MDYLNKSRGAKADRSNAQEATQHSVKPGAVNGDPSSKQEAQKVKGNSLASMKFNLLSTSSSTLSSKPYRSENGTKPPRPTLSHWNLPDLLQVPTIANTCGAAAPQILVLPPPPAAHLPPALPSRPPAGTPCGRPPSALRIRIESTQSSPAASPTSDASFEKFRTSSSHPNLLFRSSGTIKIDSPPNCHSSATLAPPAPSTGGRCAELKTNKSNFVSSELATFSSSPTNVNIQTTSPVSPTVCEDGNKEQDEEEIEKPAKNSPADKSPSLSSAEQDPTQSLKGKQELVRTNSKLGWFFKKKNNDQQINHNIIPPEIQSLRHAPLSVADVITNALLVYKKSQSAALLKNKRRSSYVQSGHSKPPQCFHCDRHFGLLCARLTCSRCTKSFCEKCLQKRFSDSSDTKGSDSSVQMICVMCIGEIERETSRGATRGLWSEFQKMRTEAKMNAGKPVAPPKSNRPIETQDIRDLTTGLHNLCLRFIRELHLQLEKHMKMSFFTTYLHNDSTSQKNVKSTKKIKECPSCGQQVRLLQDSLECSLCEQLFCSECTYHTLQLYLPVGTDLKEDILVHQIKVHVLANEQDEINSIEASEIYRVCGLCEVQLQKNIKIVDFNNKIQEIEQEMFDLQRQIDDALSYNPVMFNLTRSRSTANINRISEDDDMAVSIKMANKLYDRYTREYDTLNHMSPQTPGQKVLHKHIKQAMYEFYLKRRSQLRTSLRRRDSCLSLTNDF